MTAPTLNGLRVLSARLFQFWRGAWIAELELDPDDVAQAPTGGPTTLSLGGATLFGTVDGRGSGSFLTRASARVVGGAGGWDRVVPRQDFHSDAGVLSTDVYTQTAGLIGETVKDLTPAPFGVIDFVRTMGCASRVFGGADWFVDLDGVTNVGPRPPATADPSLTIVDFDPLKQRVDFACDGLLMPNTTLRDPRLNGATPIVRDVEQIFDRDGSRGYAWCSAQPISRLTSALANFVIEAAGRAFLRAYRYRLIEYQGERASLQAVSSQAGVPDLIPLAPWSGLAGAVATLAPGQEVFVAFDHTTDVPQPILLGYSLASLPLESKVDASLAVHVGQSAALVALAGGAGPLVLESGYAPLLGALGALASTLGALATPPGPLAPVGAAFATFAAALSSLPPSATTKTLAT
jgi:hypothetical protein